MVSTAGKFVVELSLEKETAHILLQYSNNPVVLYTFCLNEAELYTILNRIKAQRIDAKFQDNPFNVDLTTQYVLKCLKEGKTAKLAVNPVLLRTHIDNVELRFPRGRFDLVTRKLAQLLTHREIVPPYLVRALRNHFDSDKRHKDFIKLNHSSEMKSGDVFLLSNSVLVMIDEYPIYTVDGRIDTEYQYLECLQLDAAKTVINIDTDNAEFKTRSLKQVLRLDIPLSSIYK